MSVQRKIVPVPIATGIDTDVDPKQLTAKLLICENGYVGRQGVVQKRNGCTEATGSYTEEFITKHKDRAILIGENSLRVHDGTNFDEPAQGGTQQLSFSDIAREHLSAAAGDTYYCPDIAETTTVRAISYTAYRDVAGTMTFVPCLETFDKLTGTLLDSLAGPTDGSTTTGYNRRFRLVEAGGTIIAFYLATNGGSDFIAAYEVNGTSGVIGSRSTSETVSWPALRSAEWDACLLEGDDSVTVDNGFVVYPAADGEGEQVVIGRYVPGTGFNAVYGSLPAENPVAVGCSPWGISLIPSLTPGLVGVWFVGEITAVQHVMGCCVDASLTVVAGDGSAPNVPVSLGQSGVDWADDIVNLPACSGTTDPDEAHVYWTTVASSTSGTPAAYPDAVLYKALVVKNEGTGVLSVTSVAELARKVKAMSRPFGSDATTSGPWILVQYQAEEQVGNEDFFPASAYFLIAANGEVCGKSSVGQAGPWCDLVSWASHIAMIGSYYSSSVPSGSSYLIGTTRLVGRVSDDVTLSMVPALGTEAGYQLLTVTTGVPSSLRCLERGSLHIPNSCPYVWDGQHLVEEGFLTYPEGIILAITDGGGLLATGKTYQWCATYEWADADGFVHSSAPSPPIEATISGAGDDSSAALLVPYLSLTRKLNVRVVLWGTKGDGQIFYRRDAIDNSPGLNMGAFVDLGGVTTAEDDFAGKPFLYTTGGRVSNIQPQPYRTHAVHQDRHFIVDRERESTHVWYSKSAVGEDDNEERGFEHNDRFLVQVPPDGGRIMALSSYLDRLIVFKSTRIYVVTGTGLDDSRQGQGYAAAVLLDPTIGCTNEKSVVQVPTGVMFLSNRGIYQIDQSLQRVPVGLPVKAHTDAATIAAANVIPSKGYVVFSMGYGGDALVFSYVYGMWSTFTGMTCTDAMELGGRLYWKALYTAVRIESASSFLDAGVRYSMRLRTGVMAFTGWFTFERMFSVGFLGQAIAACVFRVKTAYDAAPYFLDNQTISAATALGKYFDVAAYLASMSDSSYLDKALMIDAATSRQKIGALQNEISDEQLPIVVTVLNAYNSELYTVGVTINGGSLNSITYTADATATKEEITAGLLAAFNVWAPGQSPIPFVATASGYAITLTPTGLVASITVTLPLTADPPPSANQMSVTNGSPTDDAGYSLSLLAYEIGVLPEKWPSSIIGTARGM